MLHKIAFLLLIVGGLNWLLVGIFGWDISRLWGDMGSMISRIIYVLVGLAALVELFTHKKCCKMCGAGKSHDMGSTPAGGMNPGM
jgi:uncharacterized protein